MDAWSEVPWWIVTVDGRNMLLTAPNPTLATWYAQTTYQHETGRWPRTTTTPRPATTNDLATWSSIVDQAKRQADNNPNYTPDTLTESTLAYHPYSLKPANHGDTPPPQPPNYRTPPPHLINRTHITPIAKDLTNLWLWCLGAIIPALISLTYWTGHFANWWTAIGWDRTTGWFTNRTVMATYILWILIPTQSLWFIGWIIATTPWLNHRITNRPYLDHPGITTSQTIPTTAPRR